MCKLCVKCDTPMIKEDGFYICTRCLDEIVQIKRQMWTESSEEIKQEEGVIEGGE